MCKVVWDMMHVQKDRFCLFIYLYLGGGGGGGGLQMSNPMGKSDAMNAQITE